MRVGSVVAPKRMKEIPHLSNRRFRRAQLFTDDELLLVFPREAKQSSP